MLTKTDEQIVRLARQYRMGLISHDELLCEMSLVISSRSHEQVIEEDLD